MERLDFYFRQLVTEGDLDLAFDQVQDRAENATSEHGFDGMIQGGNVSQNSPAGLSVIVSGGALGYTPDGKRVAWTAGETVDCSVDNLGSATAVTTPGNSKILSVFVEFDEDLQDLRLDGFGNPVYFKRLASKNLFIVQSPEAVSPTPPALLSDALLLADLTLAFGQTQIQTGDIDVSRRQDFFRNEAGGTTQIVRGTTRDVLNDLLDAHNGFIDDVARQSSPSGATLVGIEGFSATPIGGSSLGYSTGVTRDAINSLITDLTGSAGGTKVGAGAKTGSVISLPAPLSLPNSTLDQQMSTMLNYLETIRNTPFAASSVSYTPHDYVTATNVQDAIDELIDDLQSTAGGGGSGSYEIGYKGLTQALTTTTYANMNISAGPLETALDTMVTRQAAMVQRGGDYMTGILDFQNQVTLWTFNSTDTVIWRKKDDTRTAANQKIAINIDGSDTGTSGQTLMTLGGAVIETFTPVQMNNTLYAVAATDEVIKAERYHSTATTGEFIGLCTRARTGGNMADDFGAALGFEIYDATSGSVDAGRLAFVRAGADNTTRLVATAKTTGSDSLLFTARATNMVVYSSELLPGATGNNLGSTSLRWDLIAGTVSANGAISGASLNLGTGNITCGGINNNNEGITNCGSIGGATSISCTSLNAGSGTIQTTGSGSFGGITGTSLNAGSGLIQTTGEVRGDFFHPQGTLAIDPGGSGNQFRVSQRNVVQACAYITQTGSVQSGSWNVASATWSATGVCEVTPYDGNLGGNVACLLATPTSAGSYSNDATATIRSWSPDAVSWYPEIVILDTSSNSLHTRPFAFAHIGIA